MSRLRCDLLGRPYSTGGSPGAWGAGKGVEERGMQGMMSQTGKLERAKGGLAGGRPDRLL